MAICVQITKRLKNFVLHIDLTSQDGCMGILGASGCGKSMTLKCIAGIEKPDQGKIILNDRVLFDAEKKIDLPPQKRRVGYLFQQYALFPNMTVRQNIAAGLRGSGKSFCREKEKKDAIDRLLNQFHLDGMGEMYPRQLSGGQQQRTALARMLASDPEILLLDEPFSALDSYLREKLMQEMKGFLTNYGRDVLMVSHSRDEIYQMCEQMAIMGKGYMEIAGETKILFDQPRTLEAARLTGCKNISRIKRLGKYRLYAIDWGVELSVQEEITPTISHVGIRAHDFCEEYIEKKESTKEKESATGEQKEGSARDRACTGKREYTTGNGEECGDGQSESIPSNVLPCTLERITEAPFEVYLLLRKSEGEKQSGEKEETANCQPLWWKMSKKEWKERKEKVPDRLYFPPEHLILLSDKQKG